MVDLNTKIRKVLLSAAVEDRCGLYEVVWEINSMFPLMPLGKKYLLAHAAMEDLLKKGLVQMLRVTSNKDDSTPGIMGIEDSLSALNEPTSWYPEYPENVSMCFEVTPEGLRLWKKGDLDPV